MGQSEHSYDVFISFAQADAAWVEGYLLDALEQAGIHYHTEEAFTLGVPRLVEFERAIQGSKRTLLILSPVYLAGQFAQFTDLLAQTYGLETATWPVIPLVLQPVQLPPRLASLVRLEGTDPATWEKIIAQLCRELQKPAPGLPPRPPCPYPGMVPFGEADSGRFFGRDREVQELIQRLRQHPFVAVIGPSGSGKSSLVFAGFLPALRKSSLFGSGPWLVRVMRPSDSPLAALTSALGGDPVLPGTAALSTAALETTIPALLASPPGAQRLLLIVDQFEETFALTAQDSELFQKALSNLVQFPGCYVLLTVRADFYADLMACPLWDEIRQHRLEVPPMDEDGLRQAIVRPAEDADVFVETALVERLAADAAGEPGVLPLVQETLVLLWESVERRFLPVRAYESLILSRREYGGPERTGLQVAIAQRAEAALSQLSATGQVVARRIFLRLVQFGEGRADTRRRQTISALRSAQDDPALFEQTLRHLAESRLLTLSSEEGAGERRVDISHEALIGGWPRLQDWLAARKETEQTRRRLEGKATEWERLGRGGGGLLDDVELLEAERWLAVPDATDLGYSEALSRLVAASRAAIEQAVREKEESRQRELDHALALAESQRTLAAEQRKRAEEQARAAWGLRRVLVGLAVMFALALLAAGWAINAQSVAHRNELFALTQQAIALTKAQDEKSANATAVAERDIAGQQRSIAQAKEIEAVNAQATALAERDNADQQRQIALDQGATAMAERNVAATAQAEAEAQRDEAGRQRIIALSRQLAAQALNHLDKQLDLAMLLSLEANRFSDTPEIQGSLLATLSSANQYLITYLHGHQDDVRAVAFSPKGDLLATGDSTGLILFWAVNYTANAQAAQRVESSIAGHKAAVKGLAFSPDGARLVSASDDATLIMWDVATGSNIGLPMSAHQARVNAVAFSPDGKMLASGSDDKTIILWNAETRQPLGEPMAGHTDVIVHLAFSPDGNMLASGGSDKTIILWDVQARKATATLIKHTNSVLSVAFNPQNANILAAGDRDGIILLWDVQKRQPIDPPLRGHTDRVLSIAFSPDGRTLVSGSRDNTIRLWDVETHQSRTAALRGHTNWVRSVAFSHDGAMVASGGNDDVVILWDVNGTQSLGHLLTRYTSELTGVAVRSDNQALAMSSANGQVLLWDMSGTAPISTTLSGHSEWANCVAFSPDGRLLVSGSDDKTIRFWNGQTGQPLGDPVTGHTSYVLSIAFSPDGKLLASGGEEGSVILWDVGGEAGAPRQPLGLPLQGHSDRVTSVAFSPDGKTLASASWDGTIVLWDIASHKQIGLPLTGHTDWVTSVAFSPDGKMLASGDADSMLILWDVATGQPLSSPLVGHTDIVRSVVFSPAGDKLVSCGDDKTILLWDAATRQLIGALPVAHTSKVRSIAFVDEGTVLVSVGDDGKAIMWDVEFSSWQARACHRANRNLTQTEWVSFIGQGQAYMPTCPDLSSDQ